MAGLNKCLIMGSLGHDPSLKYLPSGDAVCNLSIATSEEWKDKQTGAKKSRTEWHKAVAFGKTGEIIKEYFFKGGLILIEGKLQTRSWEAKDGSKKQQTEIVVSNFSFCGKNGGSEPDDREMEQRHPVEDEQDIPF